MSVSDTVTKCDFCHSSFKSKYTLKSHIINNKSCLKKRGLKLETKIQCKACLSVFTHQSHLSAHQETCKEYLKYNYEQIILSLRTELAEKNNLLIEKQSKLDKLHQDIIVKDQSIQLKDKQILYLETQNKDQFDKIKESYERIAKEAVSRPTTTNNTVNHIRNNLSMTYTLDTLKEDDLVDLFRENLTEKVFMSGQKGLAKLCTDKIINTKDSKKLLCCTDATRKKFKYMDKSGNMIEDIEARTFVNKMTKPIREVGQQIYDSMLSAIDEERDHVQESDYGKKDRLTTQTFQVMDRYRDIINIDDPKYNTEFTSELAILNKSAV